MITPAIVIVLAQAEREGDNCWVGGDKVDVRWVDSRVVDMVVVIEK